MYVYVVSWCWILLCHDAELCCVRCHSATDPTAFSVWPQVSVSMRLFPLVDLQSQLKGWTNAEDTAMVATGRRRPYHTIPGRLLVGELCNAMYHFYPFLITSPRRSTVLRSRPSDCFCHHRQRFLHIENLTDSQQHILQHKSALLSHYLVTT